QPCVSPSFPARRSSDLRPKGAASGGRRTPCPEPRPRERPPSHLLQAGLQELALVEPGIEAALGHQLLVGAPLDHPALIQDQDLVGLLDGGDPVGDEQGGPPRITSRKPWRIRSSVWVSTAERASSRMRMGGSLARARA